MDKAENHKINLTMLSQSLYFSVFASAPPCGVSIGTAELSRKNIQKTERWGTEKFLPSATSRHRQLPKHNARRHFSAFHSAMRNHDKFDPLTDHLSVLAFVQANCNIVKLSRNITAFGFLNNLPMNFTVRW